MACIAIVGVQDLGSSVKEARDDPDEAGRIDRDVAGNQGGESDQGRECHPGGGCGFCLLAAVLCLLPGQKSCQMFLQALVSAAGDCGQFRRDSGVTPDLRDEASVGGSVSR